MSDHTSRSVHETTKSCSVEIVDSTGRFSRAQVDWLADKARAALSVMGVSGALSVRIVDDAEMSAAHLEYADIEGTTDVLTFDLGTEGAVLETDILACLDEATRQSERRGHTVQQELLLYIIHGVLHCLGYDDHDEAEYARMHAEEDRIMVALGLGATFAKPGGAA